MTLQTSATGLAWLVSCWAVLSLRMICWAVYLMRFYGRVPGLVCPDEYSHSPWTRFQGQRQLRVAWQLAPFSQIKLDIEFNSPFYSLGYQARH